MVKIFMTLIISSLILFADSLPSAQSIMPKGASLITIKAMMMKNPNDLDPDMVIAIGSMYQFGMKEMSLNKDISKAKKYYKNAANRGAVLANLLLANIAIEERELQTYVKEMETIIKAKDDKLSVLAGYQLSAFWISRKDIQNSVNTLLYIADIYDEPKAQFMAGWAIVSGEYKSHDLTKNDGEFYLYQACVNPKATKQILQQCDLYGPKQ